MASINLLKSKGFDVKSIGIDHPGVTDKEVMAIALSEERTILTYDSDYGELIFKHQFKPTSGVIFIRYQPSDPLETARVVEELTTNHKLIFENYLTVIDKNSIRQRKF
jgi:predicted nuclease of predicted toxin-antitoxin system